MKTLIFLVVVCTSLWLTRPGEAVRNCKDVNLPYYCEILEKE